MTLRRTWFPALLALALAAALTFLTLPVVAIFVDRSPGDLIESLGEEGALDALWLSLRTTAISMLIIVAVGTHFTHAEFLERDLPGDRLIPSLHDTLEVPREIPGVSRISAVAERCDPVSGGDGIAIIPHQYWIKFERPDRALLVAGPL